MQEPNKILRFLQTSSKELSFSDSQPVDFVELASNPQTESKRNTWTTISNLHKVIFDKITISTIKTSVDIKKYIYKYTDNQVHINYTYRLPKGMCWCEIREAKTIFYWQSQHYILGLYSKNTLTFWNFNSLISTRI